MTEANKSCGACGAAEGYHLDGCSGRYEAKPPTWFPDAGTWVSAAGDPSLRVEEVRVDRGCVKLSDGSWAAFSCLRPTRAPQGYLPNMKRVVIESPFGRNEDGSKCTPAEYARNGRYLDRCIRDSLSRGEAPYASHGFFPKEGRLDDTDLAQRTQGIAAGLAWAQAADLIAVYADHGVTEGMVEGIERHRARVIDFTYRYIGEEP